MRRRIELKTLVVKLFLRSMKPGKGLVIPGLGYFERYGEKRAANPDWLPIGHRVDQTK